MNQISTPGSFNQQPVNQQSASNIPPSPAIIELANNSEGLTVADVAQQAARIHDINRGLPEDEVNISLHLIIRGILYDATTTTISTKWPAGLPS